MKTKNISTETISECIICKNKKFQPLFKKKAVDGEKFSLLKCKKCGLQLISPRPTREKIAKYYNKTYFTKRSERGYNNYFSKEIKTEIDRVIKLNLADLNFKEINEQGKNALDIGCAAGYFVNYLARIGWHAAGLDLSKECVDFAKKKLKLNVKNNDYLKSRFPHKFDLITLWATIEHLHYPEKFLEKIFTDLKVEGQLYISTCRTGGINFMKLFNQKWRYYNFPEHLYFFSIKNIKTFLQNKGFEIIKIFTYGSGLGKSGSLLRKIADFTAKYFRMGDMMVISARKK